MHCGYRSRVLIQARITGAGSGIGLEFAKVLLQHGCNVLVADLKLRPEAEDVFKKYRGNEDARAEFHETDVTNWGQLRAAFDAAMKAFGQLDIVCPGAGTFEPVSISSPSVEPQKDLP